MPNQNIDWYADIMEVTAKDIIDKFGKITVLEHIKEIENVSDQEVAIVEDTVKTLDRIRKSGNYITVHISSFIDRE